MTRLTHKYGMTFIALVVAFVFAFAGIGIAALSSVDAPIASATTLSGSGTASEPYLIGTAAELAEYRDIINGANGQMRNFYACARLTADIDLGNAAWEPIGFNSSFQGTFDGAGYTVSGLYVNKPTNYGIGFFSKIQNAVVKNLTIKGSITGCSEVGGIVGRMYGNATVYKCTNECTVYAARATTSVSEDIRAGGIAGFVYNAGNVINACTNKGRVYTKVSEKGEGNVGGIAGYAGYAMQIKNCVNFGDVTGIETVGGIVGYFSTYGGDGFVEGCYNHGIVTSTSNYASNVIATVGGIAGTGSGRIAYCGNTGTVTGIGSRVGGVVADMTSGGIISCCYNTGTLTGRANVAGIAAYAYRGSITNCYNTGNVRVNDYKTDVSAGIQGSGSSETITYVINRGTVTNTNGQAYPYNRRGSIAGDPGTNGVVNHAYYLDGTYKDGIGTYSTNPNATSTKLSAAQMRNQSSFAGFDFDNVWIMGDNYPVLRHVHDFTYEVQGATINGICDRPYCEEEGGVTCSLTLCAPTLTREKGAGDPAASFDADELAAFNAITGLSVSASNIEYVKDEGGSLTVLDSAPITEGDYIARLTIGGQVLSVNYTIEKLVVEFDQDVLLNGEPSDSTVDNLNGETAVTLLTEEEIERYINGEDVSIYLSVTTDEGALSIPKADKTVAKAAVEAANVQEGSYLDLSLFKQIGVGAATPIHESDTVFDITVDIPAAILQPFGVTRTYSVIRIHNGQATTLPCTVSNGKISFSTDRFSTYLIAYSDDFDEQGEYIEFTADIQGEDVRGVVDEDIGSTVVVTYKITHNDGFNSILLIPQFNKTVFAIRSFSVNETALGLATTTQGDGTKKILLENVGAKYEALDGDNEFFLTVTYELIALKSGEYRFGLLLGSSEENGASVAYYIQDGEQKGEQTQVPIKVIEPVLTLTAKQHPEIEIGYNRADGSFNDGVQDVLANYYLFEYSKSSVTTAQVGELLLSNQGLENETLAPQEAQGLTVYYLFRDSAGGEILAQADTPAITVSWSYYLEQGGWQALDSAPSLPGVYKVTLTSADGIYYSCEASAYVTIIPRAISITIDDKESAYGDSIVALTPGGALTPDGILDGDSIYVNLSTTATSSSDVGDYAITGAVDPAQSVGYSVNNLYGSDVLYEVTFVNGTYTITPKQVTLTANDQTAKYTGEEPQVDQTAYVLEGVDPAGLIITIDKEQGVDVGTYTLTPAVTLSNNYELTIHTGIFSITTAGKDAEYIEAFLVGLEKVYNGQTQELLGFADNTPAWISGNVTSATDIYSQVGQYTLNVTIQLSEQDAINYTNGEDYFEFAVQYGRITPAPVTFEATDREREYGQVANFLTDNQTLVSGTLYGTDELEFYVTYYDKATQEALPNSININTNVGVYGIRIEPKYTYGNYDITCLDGDYTITKATASVTASVGDVYYNRSLADASTANVNDIGLTPVVTYYADSARTQETTPSGVGLYYVKAVVAGTDNYFGAEAEDTFEILAVKLADVTFTYSHGNATWTAVESDCGKTAEEAGVEGIALKSGTTVSYEVYDGNTKVADVAASAARSFDAAGATVYTVKAIPSDDNYLPSETAMVAAYQVSFDEGNHPGNPDGEVTNIPADQFIFAGQTVVAPASEPSLDGCDFSAWSLNDQTYLFVEEVNSDCTLVAIWDAVTYTVTLKYLPTSETEGTDMFTISGLLLNQAVSYAGLGVAPTKASTNPGIYYTFANVWKDENNVSYDAVNNAISGFTVSGNMTFVAEYDLNYNSFTITYLYSENEATSGYVQDGETQTVQYGDPIEYRAFGGEEIRWFAADVWYGDQARTEAAPAVMPNHDISVYGTYKFDIGSGDVNGDHLVNADDITLYRQWIVGGYTIQVVNAGEEWATASAANFDANKTYFLKRTADDNHDNNRDIRDVSIIRMATAGGYGWDILSADSVSGQEIARTAPVQSINAASLGLTNHGRIRLFDDVSSDAHELSFTSDSDIYVDLGGFDLTVRYLTLRTTGINATITILNGTINATNGITIAAPNGNVVINDVDAYVSGAPINLQAADNSLHFVGNVGFYHGIEGNAVPAVINIEEGTHVVLEQQSEVVFEKIVVTENNFADVVTSPDVEITIDNNTEAEIEVEWNMVISDLAGLVAARTAGGSYVLGADITYAGQLCFVQDATLDLNGHTIRSTTDVALSVTDGKTLTIKGNGNVIAQEMCVMAFDGSTLIIEGGTYTAIDNAVFGTNGTAGRGGNTITINGGTFNITDGVGILARSGSTYVGEDVIFNVTGDGHLGKVGDSNVTVPSGEELVLDLKAGYPGGDPTLTESTEFEVYIVE